MKIKKILLPLIALFALAITSSCSKDVTYTYDYVVNPGHWVTNANVNYYYASFQNADITPEVMEHGIVVAYVWDENSKSWNQLPYILPITYNFSDGSSATVPENLRFDWNTGVVTFILQDLDGVLPEGMADIPSYNIRVSVIR